MEHSVSFSIGFSENRAITHIIPLVFYTNRKTRRYIFHEDLLGILKR